MSSKLRFSQRSPCDFMIFDGTRNLFFTFELKTFLGSCTFERTEKDKGLIHLYQIKSLQNFSKYKNVISGFILDFRTSGNTYFLNIEEWDFLIESITKKSFNEADLLKYCNPILLEKKKLKVNWKYSVEKLFNDLSN